MRRTALFWWITASHEKDRSVLVDNAIATKAEI